jgi:hypothetical protein
MLNTHVKGSRWRHKVEGWLSEAGFQTSVRGIGFPGDDVLARLPQRNDLVLSVEAKNAKTITLAAFVDQAVENAHDDDELALPVVVVHRKGRAEVDDAYVVMPGWAFIELVTR